MQIKKVQVWRRVVGFLIIIIGLLGLAFPILPGWLLIFVGLEFIGLQLVFFDKIKNYAKSKIENSKKDI